VKESKSPQLVLVASVLFSRSVLGKKENIVKKMELEDGEIIPAPLCFKKMAVKYTWCNDHDTPIYENLRKFLCQLNGWTNIP
jgi:hypothetical protein